MKVLECNKIEKFVKLSKAEGRANGRFCEWRRHRIQRGHLRGRESSPAEGKGIRLTQFVRSS